MTRTSLSSQSRTLIVGLGSSHGDDRAGWHVVEDLAAACRRRTDICLRRALVPLDLLDWVERTDNLHICDACEAPDGAGAGLHQLRWDGSQLVDASASAQGRTIFATEMFRSRGTHDFGLPDVLRLAQATSGLPEHVTVWAVSGISFEPAEPMSPATMAAARRAVPAILRSLEVRAGGHA